MAKPSLEDLRTMYQNSLLILKNKPVVVETIYGHTKIGVFDLNSQRKETIEINSHLDLKAPGRCLGFVNYDGICVYVSRLPVRRYKVGLCGDNVAWTHTDNFRGAHIPEHLHHLKAPELADTIKNRYPSIEEAWNRVKQGAEKIVAFDRQFAIDGRGNVYFKKHKAGYAKNPKTVYDIKFEQGSEYLITLLDGNYEKSVPTAG